MHVCAVRLNNALEVTGILTEGGAAMSTVTVYGPGGYDPDAPDHNIVEVIEVPDEDPAPE